MLGPAGGQRSLSSPANLGLPVRQLEVLQGRQPLLRLVSTTAFLEGRGLLLDGLHLLVGVQRQVEVEVLGLEVILDQLVDLRLVHDGVGLVVLAQNVLLPLQPGELVWTIFSQASRHLSELAHLLEQQRLRLQLLATIGFGHKVRRWILVFNSS